MSDFVPVIFFFLKHSANYLEIWQTPAVKTELVMKPSVRFGLSGREKKRVRSED